LRAATKAGVGGGKNSKKAKGLHMTHCEKCIRLLTHRRESKQGGKPESNKLPCETREGKSGGDFCGG